MINYTSFMFMVNEAEDVIKSNYHFTFPKLDDENVSSNDLMISILQTRILTEGICRYIVLREHIAKNEKDIQTATLDVYIGRLRPSFLVPLPIITHMERIQKFSNFNVHYHVEGHLSLREGHECMESLYRVLDWFLTDYMKEPSNKWKINSDILKRGGNVPPKVEGCIIPRNEEVRELRQILINDGSVVLCSYTGIGKTELAKDYVKEYGKKYDGVFYVENVNGADDFIYNLPISLGRDKDTMTKEETVSEKLKVIHSLGTKHLFIIDNYTGTKDDLRCLYPEKQDKYHLMVAVDDDSEFAPNDECYPVKAFSEDESLKIFRYFCPEKYTDEEVLNLLAYVLYNPRAIKMSAIFLRDNNSFSPSGLIECMKRNSSVKSIIQSLYLVLTEISILESDDTMRLVAEYISLLPYNGVSLARFQELVGKTRKQQNSFPFIKEDIKKAWDRLIDAGWMDVDRLPKRYHLPAPW